MELGLGLAILAFAAVFLIFFGFDRIISQPTAIESRLDQYASRGAAKNAIDAASADNNTAGARSARRSLLNANMSKRLEIELARADLRFTPAEYVMINVGLMLFGIVLGFYLGRNSINGLIYAVLAGVAGFYGPRLYIRFLQNQRLNAFNNQLADTLLLLANALRSGYSLLQSMETVAKELPPPMSAEFDRVTREIGLGLTIDEALAHMVERINSDDLDLIVTAINIQHEVGGNLAEILDTIAHTIRERVRIKGQIRAVTSMQRMSGTVISLLPIGLGGVIFVVNTQYMLTLFENQCGILMMVVGGVMMVVGYLAIRRITQIEV